MIYYNHIHNLDGSDLTTAATIENDQILIGWARCSPKDNFSKHIGRGIAHSRLMETPSTFKLAEAKKAIKRQILDVTCLSYEAKNLIIDNMGIEDISTKFVAELLNTNIYDN